MKFRPKLDAFRDLLGNRADGDGYVTPGNAITRAIYEPIEADLAFEGPGGVSRPVADASNPSSATRTAPLLATERTCFESDVPLEPSTPITRRVVPPAAAPTPALIDGVGDLAGTSWSPPAMEPLPETEHEPAAILAEPPVASPAAEDAPAAPAADERAA